mmetsp:Transcript_101339/g.321876  ORF Transcript_101339/g.321876 Transcript_101339/m.321876 type:complete len:271 (-) Transcript_101339:1090-1902(-)
MGSRRTCTRHGRLRARTQASRSWLASACASQCRLPSPPGMGSRPLTVESVCAKRPSTAMPPTRTWPRIEPCWSGSPAPACRRSARSERCPVRVLPYRRPCQSTRRICRSSAASPYSGTSSPGTRLAHSRTGSGRPGGRPATTPATSTGPGSSSASRCRRACCPGTASRRRGRESWRRTAPCSARPATRRSCRAHGCTGSRTRRGSWSSPGARCRRRRPTRQTRRRQGWTCSRWCLGRSWSSRRSRSAWSAASRATSSVSLTSAATTAWPT